MVLVWFCFIWNVGDWNIVGVFLYVIVCIMVNNIVLFFNGKKKDGILMLKVVGCKVFCLFRMVVLYG